MIRSRSLGLRRSAFTLLEILIVVAIIVVVAGIGGAYLFGALERGKIDAAKAQMKVIEDQIEQYRLVNNGPPATLQVLTLPDQLNEGQPYIKDQKAIYDPWGNLYGYEYNSRLGPVLYFTTPGGVTHYNANGQNQQGQQMPF